MEGQVRVELRETKAHVQSKMEEAENRSQNLLGVIERVLAMHNQVATRHGIYLNGMNEATSGEERWTKSWVNSSGLPDSTPWSWTKPRR